MHWYALQVKYRHEKAVARALHGKGYEAFLPLYRSQHRSGRKLEDVDLPLFPTYVFCRFDPLRRLAVLQTPGVFSVIAAGSTLLKVDDEELAAVRVMLASQLPVEPWPYLELGDEVVVEEGPLRGTRGMLLRYRNQDRLVISVTLLQRSVSVEIDRGCVRAAAAVRSSPIPRVRATGFR